MCIIGILYIKLRRNAHFLRHKDSFINLYFIICTMDLTISINNFNKLILFLPEIFIVLSICKRFLSLASVTLPLEKK